MIRADLEHSLRHERLDTPQSRAIFSWAAHPRRPPVIVRQLRWRRVTWRNLEGAADPSQALAPLVREGYTKPGAFPRKQQCPTKGA